MVTYYLTTERSVISKVDNMSGYQNRKSPDWTLRRLASVDIWGPINYELADVWVRNDLGKISVYLYTFSSSRLFSTRSVASLFNNILFNNILLLTPCIYVLQLFRTYQTMQNNNTIVTTILKYLWQNSFKPMLWTSSTTLFSLTL